MFLGEKTNGNRVNCRSWFDRRIGKDAAQQVKHQTQPACQAALSYSQFWVDCQLFGCRQDVMHGTRSGDTAEGYFRFRKKRTATTMTITTTAISIQSVAVIFRLLLLVSAFTRENCAPVFRAGT